MHKSHRTAFSFSLVLTLLNAVRAQAPTLLADLTPGPVSTTIAHLTDVAGTLFFLTRAAAGDTLWRSNGTTASTVPVMTFAPPSGLTGPLCALGGKLLLRAPHPTLGTELWVSDGTTAGTSLVKDLWAGSSSGNPGQLVAMRDAVYFVAGDDAHRRELWRTDGTANGTSLVKDIAPGMVASDPRTLRVVGDNLLFFVNTPSPFQASLWRSDGSTLGTVPVATLAQNLTGNPPNEFVVAGARMFFGIDAPSSGRELWVSDGTTAGTQLVADVVPGWGGSDPTQITAFGDGVCFRADDGSGPALWRSNGTAAGTAMVHAINFVNLANALDGKLLFSADNGITGHELWSSDGTPAGTQLVLDLVAGPYAGWPRRITPVGRRFACFFANGGTTTNFVPNELWLTDGTPANTTMFDVNPGFAGSLPSSPMLAESGGFFYVALDDGVHGIELHTLEPGALAQRLGFGCAEPGRQPVLDSGDPVLGTTVELRGSGCPVGSAAVVLLGFPGPPITLVPGCTGYQQLPDLAVVAVVVPTGPDWTSPFSLPASPALAGEPFVLQGVHLPTGAPLGFDLTNGLRWRLGF